MSRRVDVIIVGSGPVGAAYARCLSDARPGTSILMIEAGPVIAAPPGVNVRNILDLGARSAAQAGAQGREAPLPGMEPDDRPAIRARPGTHLLRPAVAGADPQLGMPSAAMSTCAGGMGAHWTCACPEPGGEERIPFLDSAQWERALDRARQLLAVTTGGFPATPAATAVRRALGRVFAPLIGDARPVGPMPLACTPSSGGLPRWSGADTVLGDILVGNGSHVHLRTQTLCREVVVDGDHARGAVLEDLVTGERETVEATVVIAACDALRTPQLLYASGVRPVALGRYLNDQPQLVAAALVPEGADRPVAEAARSERGDRDGRDLLTGVSWVPYATPDHPYHGQVMQLDASPIDLGVDGEGGAVVGLGWFCAKDVRPEDRVAFSDRDRDSFGMPAMEIEYALTDVDRARIAAGMEHQRRAADALGGFVGGEPRLLPAGSSLHYQGTVRMGDDGGEASVCGPDSRVWNVKNLFVGGNGVIPTATACNPTLTSVALAVTGARAALSLL